MPETLTQAQQPSRKSGASGAQAGEPAIGRPPGPQSAWNLQRSCVLLFWVLIAIVLVYLTVTAWGAAGVELRSSTTSWPSLHAPAGYYISQALIVCSLALLGGLWLRSRHGHSRQLLRLWQVLTIVFGAAFVLRWPMVHHFLVRSLRGLDQGAAYRLSSMLMGLASVSVAVGVGLYLIRFLGSLTRGVRLRFVVGGICFLVGMVGLEALSEWIWSPSGIQSRGYVLVDGLEKLFEVVGLALFVDGLFMQWRHQPAERSLWRR